MTTTAVRVREPRASSGPLRRAAIVAAGRPEVLIPIGAMADARALLQGLLDEVGLSTYRLQLDAESETWRIAVECPTNGNWRTIHLTLGAQALAAARDPGSARRAILASIAEQLADCDREALS